MGNLNTDGRVALILMDYPNRRRLKIWGRARLIHGGENAEWLARLEMPGYRAQVERAIIILVEAYDWNCPQHITPRFTEAEIAAAATGMQQELAELKAENAKLKSALSHKKHMP